MIELNTIRFLQIEKHKIRVLLGAFIFVLISSASYAQQEWEKEGGIPNAEIEIIKDRKITLPQADRNFDKIPPRPAEPLRPEITYDFKNVKFNTPDYNPLIRPLKLKQEEISKTYGNYVSAGYGNYASPYLEAYFNSKRDKNKYYGVHLYHQSYGKGPVDDKNSASGATEINLFGKSMSRNVVASGNLNYENRTTYFYGYTPGTEPARDNIRQSYNILSLGAGIENSQPSDFTYNLKGSYSYLEDRFKSSESEAGLTFNSDYKTSEKSKLILNAEYFLISRKDSMVQFKARNLFKLKPAFMFSPIDKLWLTLGGNVVVENDTIAKSKATRIYPNFHANYNLSESVSVYAGLTGDIDKVSLHTLSRENLWVNSDLSIFHTNRSAEFLSGLKGKLLGKLAFGTGFSYAVLKNLYYFQNDLVDRSKFDVIYGNTNRLNLFAELGFSPGDAVKMSVRGDYYKYSAERVFHRPTYRLAFNSAYNIYDKVWLNVDFIGQGGMKAFDPEKSAIVTIKPALDLNFKLDYFFSRKVSAFLKLNNVLSNNYQVYLHYPVRGFQVMGGVSWSF